LRHDYEMGLTRADFLRLLPVAVGNAPFRVEGDEIASAGGSPAWRIRLRECPPRAFGPVELPVLAVGLSVDGAAEADARRFVARFLLGFQRAGG
jgi:hypothetical protein